MLSFYIRSIDSEGVLPFILSPSLVVFSSVTYIRMMMRKMMNAYNGCMSVESYRYGLKGK